MKAADYEKTWRDLSAERTALLDRRVNHETQLIEINNEISHLDEVLSHLAPLAGMSDSIPGMGITDAIRSILRNSSERMSAKEVFGELEEGGYDLSRLTAPMASIYKILSRLVNDSKEVERETEGDGAFGRVFYKWKRYDGPEITDEDIPF
jgi:hypothetical protein